jgi:prevent-host-death family protein
MANVAIGIGEGRQAVSVTLPQRRRSAADSVSAGSLHIDERDNHHLFSAEAAEYMELEGLAGRVAAFYSHNDYVDHSRPIMTKRSSIWPVADAKARLSELIERARANGPQTITRNGRPAAVIVSIDEWTRKARRKGNLAEFFARSPLWRSGLKIERSKEPPRRVEL